MKKRNINVPSAHPNLTRKAVWKSMLNLYMKKRNISAPSAHPSLARKAIWNCILNLYMKKRNINAPSTSLLNSHFQTIVRGQSEYTWQMWCVVLYFFGRWNVFVHFASGLFYFSWRNKDNNWSMCSASGMSENLRVQEVHNTRSSKGTCFCSTPK